MTGRRRVSAALAAIGTAAAAVVAVQTAQAAPAAAATGCVYPYVCFYQTSDDYLADRTISRYRDVTSDWQLLRSQSIGADYIRNTRNDDVAYLLFADGGTTCVEPHGVHYWSSRAVIAVRIDSSATC